MNKFVFQKKIENTENSAGFTLIELMVSVSVFTIVVFMCLSSILAIMDANKKSQTLRAVMDNLNFSMESMTRDIRFGENYHCGATPPSLDTPNNCTDNANGSNTFTFKSSGGTLVTYKQVGTRVVKTMSGTDYNVTSPDVTITNLAFRVYGSPSLFTSSDVIQPRVIIVITGYAGVKQTTRSSFVLETTVSQRKLDL